MQHVNLIFPVTIYTEQTSFFINLEGRIRITTYIITPVKKIFADWKIIQALVIIKRRLLVNNFSIFSNFYYIMSFFNNLINYVCSFFFNINSLKLILKKTNINFKELNISFFINLLIFNNYFKYKLLNSFFNRYIFNYYLSDIFCVNSKVMSICASKLKFSYLKNYKIKLI